MSEWPKRFEPGEEIPEELQDDDDVFLFEEDVEEGEPDIVAQHRVESPDVWLRLRGVAREDIDENERHFANKAFLDELDHTGLSLTWFDEDDVAVVRDELVLRDIQNTVESALEALAAAEIDELQDALYDINDRVEEEI